MRALRKRGAASDPGHRGLRGDPLVVTPWMHYAATGSANRRSYTDSPGCSYASSSCFCAVPKFADSFSAFLASPIVGVGP